MYTLLTSSRLALGMGSPVMISTFPMPSAHRPISSAWVALRLRSRQVMWGRALMPSSLCSLQAARLESTLARATGQSAMVMMSTSRVCSSRAPETKFSRLAFSGGSSSTATALRFVSQRASQKGFSTLEGGGASAAGRYSARTLAGAFRASQAAAIYAGVVPQQPPRIRAPSSRRMASCAA